MITTKDFMLCNSITEQELETDKSRYTNTNKYLAQYKKDGERIIAVKTGEDIILVNRRGRVCNNNFREVVEDLKKLGNALNKEFILDGEIIAYDGDFIKLQRRALTKDKAKIKCLEKEIPVKYMVFDVLSYDKNNKQSLPLKDRIEILKKIFDEGTRTTTDTNTTTNNNNVQMLEFGEVFEMLNKARANKEEGIVIKDLDGIYENRRSPYFLKLKFFKEADIIFTKYEVNNAGIRVSTSDDLIACQVAGIQSREVQEFIDRNGKVELTIQYLSKNEETGSLRFPSFKQVVVGEYNK